MGRYIYVYGLELDEEQIDVLTAHTSSIDADAYVRHTPICSKQMTIYNLSSLPNSECCAPFAPVCAGRKSVFSQSLFANT